MKCWGSVFSLGCVLSGTADAQWSSLYGALALAGLPQDIQTSASRLPAALVNSVNCYTSTLLARSLTELESTYNQAKRLFVSSYIRSVDRDRALRGLSTVIDTETDAACSSIPLEPEFCDWFKSLSRVLLKRRICETVEDGPWRSAQCSVKPKEAAPPDWSGLPLRSIGGALELPFGPRF